MQTAPQKPGHGQSGWIGRHFFWKRLSALILDEQEFFPLFAGRQQIQTSTLFPYEHPGRTLSGLNHNVTLWHYSNTSTMKNRHMPRPRRCNIPHPNPTPRLSSPAILFTQSSDRHSYSSCRSSPLSPPSPTTAKLMVFTMISTMTTKQQE